MSSSGKAIHVPDSVLREHEADCSNQSTLENFAVTFSLTAIAVTRRCPEKVIHCFLHAEKTGCLI